MKTQKSFRLSDSACKILAEFDNQTDALETSIRMMKLIRDGEFDLKWAQIIIENLTPAPECPDCGSRDFHDCRDEHKGQKAEYAKCNECDRTWEY